MQKLELLAPAGAFDSLTAAIDAGADAVYFGVEQLNMRARSANNFTLEDLPEVSRLCRAAGVRSYITLNTVLYDHDLPMMRRIVGTAAEHQIDAVIAMEPGVMQYARELGVDVHLSTQANITNVEAVKFYAQFAEVMVLSRELTLANRYKLKLLCMVRFVWPFPANVTSACTPTTPLPTGVPASKTAAARIP